MGRIITAVIYIASSLIMEGIGISQIKSKTPVTFYNGEKPPDRFLLKDMKAWNRKHGLMYIVYGIVIFISWLTAFFIGDSLWSLLPLSGGILLPVFPMIIYHNKLVREYIYH